MNARLKLLVVTFVLLIPLIGVNLACGFSFLAEPTLTPTPSETPTSTNTPLPTATRTATPNLQATQLAEREQAIRDMLTQLDLSADDGYLGWYQTREIAIDIEGLSWIFYPFAEDLIVGDFVLYTQMTWDTNTWPICGVWFRSDDRWEWGDQYMLRILRLSGLPAWAIEYWKDGYYVNTVTEKIRYSSFLDLDDGATNDIVLAAVGNEFKVFINGVFEGRYYDYSSKLSEGQFAFSASQDAGETTCSFDNSWVWVYK